MTSKEDRVTGRPVTVPDLVQVEQLYRKYAADLAEVRDAQRRFLRANPDVVAQLDDLEAEITYLLLRERRPETVVEIGTFHGWSTTWILRALHDNGVGHLYSYDLVDHAMHAVPRALAGDRWTFVRGDVRAASAMPADRTGYLFVDAAHSGRFARWYLARLFPRVPAGTPVSVHDVFHGRRPLPFTEGAVLLRWLADRSLGYLTASPARAPEVHRQLVEVRRELGLVEPVHTGRDNPMVFFTLP
ncbi:class I SAM-dependent methyltransferase [Planosporangium sp. 12N6]|uniref:class I SAM-dependent methyltransferase n=1 Tax=Planosporangium spinosum TaxID=3402278 RepID=UPI003CEB29B3